MPMHQLTLQPIVPLSLSSDVNKLDNSYAEATICHAHLACQLQELLNKHNIVLIRDSSKYGVIPLELISMEVWHPIKVFKKQMKH